MLVPFYISPQHSTDSGAFDGDILTKSMYTYTSMALLSCFHTKEKCPISCKPHFMPDNLLGIHLHKIR